jgi:hypothetical protein
MISIRRISVGLVGLIVIALWIVFFVLRTNWTPKNIGESQKRGEQIVSALRAYKQENAKYPETLTGLLPKYINRIDPPRAGNRVWDYKTYDNGSNFVLKFEGDSWREPTYWYESKLGKWSVDSK